MNGSPADSAMIRRWAGALVLAAAWGAVVPYLARALGVRLDVPARLEVVDHVVPGAVVLVATVVLVAAGRVAVGDLRWSVVAGATFLAGFWIASTHAPLIAEALAGETPWDAALLHTSSALPALAVGAAMLAAPLLKAPSRH